MIHIVEGWNANSHAMHLAQMFALRAREFGIRRGWDVVCVDGQERDALDDLSPVYVLATDDRDAVIGSCRLLPTTGPTLLEACFADTMPDGSLLVDPTIWECTRFCIDRRVCSANVELLGSVTQSVIDAVVELASRHGIETLIANLDNATLRICRRAGYEIELLGMTNRYGPIVYLGAFSVRQAARTSERRRKSVKMAGLGATIPDLVAA